MRLTDEELRLLLDLVVSEAQEWRKQAYDDHYFRHRRDRQLEMQADVAFREATATKLQAALAKRGK